MIGMPDHIIVTEVVKAFVASSEVEQSVHDIMQDQQARCLLVTLYDVVTNYGQKKLFEDVFEYNFWQLYELDLADDEKAALSRLVDRLSL